MTKYIYKSVSSSSTTSNKKNVDDFIKQLNAEGENGWCFLGFYDERHAILSKKMEILKPRDLTKLLSSPEMHRNV